MTPEPFSDRLVEAIRAAGAPACVGLDPVYERLPAPIREEIEDPADAIDQYCRAVIDAVAGICPVVKFQSACFERDGVAGIRTLQGLIRTAHTRGLLVILDAKRGDIGISAKHYARAAFGGGGGKAAGEGEHGNPGRGADALTISGYLGPDTIEPFLEPGHGAFVLVRTSNPGSDAVQSLKLEDGRTVAEMMADHVAALGRRCTGRHGYSDLGAVVAATKPQDGAALRARMPRQFFLVPGYGAQGGTADDIKPLLDGRAECGHGVLVTASRSVIYAFEPADAAWAKAVKRAALKFVDEIRAVVA